MQDLCLLIDALENSPLKNSWREQLDKFSRGKIECHYVRIHEAAQFIEQHPLACAVVFVDQVSIQLNEVLSKLRDHLGPIAALQAIVCNEVSPILMAELFDFGIEQFFSLERWPAEVTLLCDRVLKINDDGQSVEARCVRLNYAIQSGDQGRIKELEDSLREECKFDFLAAHCQGRVFEALADFNKALHCYRQAIALNWLFKPAQLKLAENLMIMGPMEDAVKLYRDLEQTNPFSVGIKASLASAYDAMKDEESAQLYLAKASEISEHHPRVIEARAQIMLSSGAVREALALMDGITNAGPFFAARLNETGINLSQSKDGELALLLYDKTHKIVRPELRFKVSLNAALACHRLQKHRQAMNYLERCENEYGSSFEKLEKIRGVVKKNLTKTGETDAA